MTERKRGNAIGEPTQKVGRTILAIRESSGITLEQLSARLESFGHPIHSSSLSKMERGMRRIDVDDLAAIAPALGVSLPRLIHDAIPFDAFADFDDLSRLVRLEDGLRKLMGELGYNETRPTDG